MQGLEPKDFAKVVATVAHFVERAATNYLSNKVHRVRAKSEKPSNEIFVFAFLGSNADDYTSASFYQKSLPKSLEVCISLMMALILPCDSGKNRT